MIAALLLTLAPASDLEAGPWRCVLESPGGELPFGLELSETEQGLAGVLVNGPERIPVTAVEHDGPSVTIRIDHYDSRITARVFDGGRGLEGNWRKRSGPATWSELPFRATAGSTRRFAGDTTDPAGSIGGRWSAKFASDDDRAVAIFEEHQDGIVTGTFLTTTGDYRYLAGSFHGNTLQLSCFDGAHAFLFRATLDGGALKGDFWSRDTWHDTWTARRDPDAELPNAFEQTVWNERASLADLVFPDVEGNPRALTEAAFMGRGVLLQVFGTWCPNCYDETEYLVELHERYADRGLSIVGLAFEMTGDFERDAAQVKKYVERHEIPYPILIAGTSKKSDATKAFGALDRVRSYPTTIFLRGDGTVHSVHTGFTGPATGPAYDHLRQQFEWRIEDLLAATPPTWGEAGFHLLRGDWHDYAGFAGGDYRFFPEGDRLRALHRVFGSGRPVVSGEVLPVRIVDDAVWIGDECFRFDEAAGVLTYPRDFGVRLAPRESPTPMLASRGMRGEEEWLEALASDEALVRREAIVAIAMKRRPVPESRFREVVPLLRDPDVEVRVAAAWAAGAVREADATEALVEHLGHPNAALRRESVKALHALSLADESLLGPLRPLGRDPDPLVRRAVERALAR